MLAVSMLWKMKELSAPVSHIVYKVADACPARSHIDITGGGGKILGMGFGQEFSSSDTPISVVRSGEDGNISSCICICCWHHMI